MKLRCPYCKAVFGPELVSSCPKCGKAMTIPDRLQKHTFKERRRTKQKLERENDHKRRHMPAGPGGAPFRGPAVLIGAILIMVITGALLVGRAKTPPLKRRSPATTAAREMRALHIATDHFYVDCGRYPTQEEGLKALVLDPDAPGWKGPYVNLIKSDPWKQRYAYTISNLTFNIRSAGPDGTFNTPDDVTPSMSVPEDIVD